MCTTSDCLRFKSYRFSQISIIFVIFLLNGTCHSIFTTGKNEFQCTILCIQGDPKVTVLTKSSSIKITTYLILYRLKVTGVFKKF